MSLLVRRAFTAATVAMLFTTPLRAQQLVTITGTVSSDAGLPLDQVEVTIPSMGLGALSKSDGRYAIVIPGARLTDQPITLRARRRL